MNQIKTTAQSTENINALIGKRLQQRREEMRIPIIEIATLLDISVDALIDIEAGRRPLSASALYTCSQVLKVDPNYFFEDLAGVATGST